MNPIKSLVAVGLLATCFCATAADPTSPTDAQAKVVPVLMQVNSHGKITEAAPAVHLSPKFRRLLRKNLNEMITKPAVDKHGQPISSQFVMNLSLQTTARSDGEYDTRFTYVSTSPVPAGSWHWVHTGHEVGLARDRHFFLEGQERIPFPNNNDNYQPTVYPDYRYQAPPPATAYASGSNS